MYLLRLPNGGQSWHHLRLLQNLRTEFSIQEEVATLSAFGYTGRPFDLARLQFEINPAHAARVALQQLQDRSSFPGLLAQHSTALATLSAAIPQGVDIRFRDTAFGKQVRDLSEIEDGNR